MPMELIAGLGTGFVSFFFKLMANQQAYMFEIAKLQMQRDAHNSGLADMAAKRSHPVTRKVVAFMVIGVGSLGLLLAAFKGIPVSLMENIPQKELLWGLFRWGSGVSVTTATGLVFPPWFGWLAGQIGGYLFGTGAAIARVGR
jgi:hypothetical protein